MSIVAVIRIKLAQLPLQGLPALLEVLGQIPRLGVGGMQAVIVSCDVVEHLPEVCFKLLCALVVVLLNVLLSTMSLVHRLGGGPAQCGLTRMVMRLQASGA